MEIKKITSRTNALIKEIASLINNKGSYSDNYFLAEGKHLIEMADSQNILEMTFSLKPLKLNSKETQYLVTKEILDKISQNKAPSSIVGLVKKKEEKIDENAKIIVYLDDIQDPGNMGTILRTSLAFSLFNIIYTPKCASIYNFKVVQSSKGALFNLNYRCDKDYHLIDKLKERGYKIITTSLSDSSIKIDDFEVKNDEKYLIVFGNEGKGVSREILSKSDYELKIPIDNIDSLNVSVAAALVLYKFKSNK